MVVRAICHNNGSDTNQTLTIKYIIELEAEKYTRKRKGDVEIEMIVVLLQRMYNNW